MLSFLLPLLVSPALGHDLGYTDVWARFSPNGTYTVDVLLDVRALPAAFPLGRTRVAQPTKVLRPSEVQAFGASATAFWTTVAHPAFDGVAALDVATLTDWTPGTPLPETGVVQVRFAGDIPPGAQAFTWSSDRDAGPLLLTLVQEGQSGSVVTFLDPGDTPAPFLLTVAPPIPGFWPTLAGYIGLGFEHIVPKGIDHILFVLGLFLLSAKTKPLLAQVSAFTVAHTLTLGLAAMGLIALPAAVVEPLIAASIAFVAIENLATARLHPWRPAVVFMFGLLHGLGFAGALGDRGLPAGQWFTGLFGFNLGVELGQLAVIGCALALVGHWRTAPWYRTRVTMPASGLIAVIALYWTVTRLINGG